VWEITHLRFDVYTIKKDCYTILQMQIVWRDLNVVAGVACPSEAAVASRTAQAPR
jgi:hypothetical protein